jgi:hypothetical protein
MKRGQGTEKEVAYYMKLHDYSSLKLLKPLSEEQQCLFYPSS